MGARDVHVRGTLLGFAADALLGDPRRGHPVAAFGRAAAALERRMWRDHRGTGALYVLLSAGGAAAAAGALTTASAARDAVGARTRTRTGQRSSGPALAPPAAPTWAVRGGTSRTRAARAGGAAREAGDLELARERRPALGGRDPQHLDAPAVARAVVESVAENTSDAGVGALVWGALAGVPGLVGFRAVNTLDAMVGHLSPRHRRFGWAAARLDDVAGWPGARLTAALAALAGPDPRGAVHAWRADAHRHPSPNAGPVEASFAGALGVRLGGTLSYGGRVEHRPVLNTRGRVVRSADIERAVRLSRRVGVLALVTSCLVGTAARRPGRGRGEGGAR
ncbi:cobalamin biosynthesis protein [Streptomyces sp. A73]|nr:cobalamin biosynthesis protein [Streptomyces sp. A73]